MNKNFLFGILGVLTLIVVAWYFITNTVANDTATPRTTNQFDSLDQQDTTSEDFDGVLDKNLATGNDSFVIVCPQGWSTAERTDYNGEVNYSGCTDTNGTVVTFGFVPQTIAETYLMNSTLVSIMRVEEVRLRPGSQRVTIGNFTGFQAVEGDVTHFIARYSVANGYYEVTGQSTQGITYIQPIIQSFTANK